MSDGTERLAGDLQVKTQAEHTRRTVDVYLDLAEGKELPEFQTYRRKPSIPVGLRLTYIKDNDGPWVTSATIVAVHPLANGKRGTAVHQEHMWYEANTPGWVLECVKIHHPDHADHAVDSTADPS